METTMTDTKVAQRLIFEDEIKRLVNLGTITEGELIIKEDPEHGLYLESTSERSVPEIMELCYGDFIAPSKELPPVPPPEPKRIISLDDARSMQRTLNRAERRRRR